MDVVLLGTGSADGWPNAWCRCRSCTWARESGTVRSTTAALVDGVLLLDCGPDAPRNADRAGVGLADVRVVLLTHGHPDHVAPEALLSRSWTAQRTTLHVLGPPSALDVCRDWIGPDDDVRLTPVAAGDLIDLAAQGLPGYVIRVLAAAHDVGRDAMTRDAVLFDVTAPDRSRLLYATDTGPLPRGTIDAVRGSAYDIVLLEETFGDEVDHGTGHLDLTTFPLELARLRDVGGVGDGTDVVAVHLSHHNPPRPDLERILAPWGARVVDDLAVVRTGSATPRRSPSRRQLLLGGVRSGKSREAERRMLAEPTVTYVATGGTRADDPEWASRVASHRARRPQAWRTVETLDVATVLLEATAADRVLVDCLALWLAGHLDRARAWESEPGSPSRAESLAVLDRATDALVAAVAKTVCAGAGARIGSSLPRPAGSPQRPDRRGLRRRRPGGRGARRTPDIVSTRTALPDRHDDHRSTPTATEHP
jgi:adenosylcobinamide kinase / adenosylcobinamide-phosphate guanylyltransferase